MDTQAAKRMMAKLAVKKRVRDKETERTTERGEIIVSYNSLNSAITLMSYAYRYTSGYFENFQIELAEIHLRDTIIQ